MSAVDRAGVLIFAALLALGFVGIALAADSDGDGWSDAYEMYLPTGHLRACPLTQGDAAWPADLNNTASVDTADIAVQTADFGKSVNGSPNVEHRQDIGPNSGVEMQGNGFIDTGDIAAITARFGQTCTP